MIWLHFEKHLCVQTNKEMDYGLSFNQLATISAQDIPICDFSGSPRLVESPGGFLEEG